jgi:hypothetical protein
LVEITIAPPLESPLCATVDSFACDRTVIVTENGLRGGVVMEDPALAAVVNLCTYPLECWGPCNCWDYPTQCHGDTDNSGDIKGSDFLALKNSWYKVYPDVAYNPCADFDRNGAVKGSDFLILKNRWYKAAPADCPGGDINCVYCR